MSKRAPLKIGNKYGRITVISDSPNNTKNKPRKVIGRCECGTEKEFMLPKLKNGHTRSCGCLFKEVALSNARETNIKHGLSDTPEYIRWTGMMSRCYNKKSVQYKDYGGRGISVASEWHDVKVFSDWLKKNGFKPDHNIQLDRIDNDGDYEPDNCRLVSRHKNMKNRRKSKIWIVFGIEYDNLDEPAKLYDVWPQTIGIWCRGIDRKDRQIKPMPGCGYRYIYERDAA